MNISTLIQDFLADVEICLGMFRDRFGREDICRASREGVFPRRGRLTASISYYFHGSGLCVEMPDRTVDFDFADATTVGFDAWRLWSYAIQFPDKYPDFQNREVVEKHIVNGIARGVFVKVDPQSSQLMMRDLH